MLGLASNSYGMLGGSKWTGSQTDGSKLLINPRSAGSNHIVNGADYDSSAIASVDYDPNTQNAKVKYTSGDKVYDFPMSPEEYNSLKYSPSKGQFMYYEARRY